MEPVARFIAIPPDASTVHVRYSVALHRQLDRYWRPARLVTLTDLCRGGMNLPGLSNGRRCPRCYTLRPGSRDERGSAHAYRGIPERA
jgi:hypothetical protein